MEKQTLVTEGQSSLRILWIKNGPPSKTFRVDNLGIFCCFSVHFLHKQESSKQWRRFASSDKKTRGFPVVLAQADGCTWCVSLGTYSRHCKGMQKDDKSDRRAAGF